MENAAGSISPSLLPSPCISNFINERYGNALITQASYQGGDIIIHVDQPYILIPSNNNIDISCYNCFGVAQAGSTLKGCRGCDIVKFCGKSCQEASWRRIHSKECRLFRRVRFRAPQGYNPTLPTPVRALIQLLLLLQPEPQLSPIAMSRPAIHREDFKLKKSKWPDIELQAMAAVEYCNYPPRYLDLAINLMCALKINAFNAVQQNGLPLGLCFDPLLALANHSCVPNSHISFDGSRASLKALRPIEIGEEVTISYINVNRPLTVRQNELRGNWFFECHCPRCLENWNEYGAFLNNKYRDADREALFINVEALERHARKVVHLSPPSFDNSTEFLAALKEGFKQMEDKAEQEVFGMLKSFSDKLTYLRDQDTIALAPYPTILGDLAVWLARVGEFEAATIVELVLVYRVSPYAYPEPWHPSRVTSLQHLADMLIELVYRDTPLSDLTVLKDIPAAKMELFPALYAVILQIAELTRRCYGESSTMMEETERRLRWLDGLQRAQCSDVSTMRQHSIKDGNGLAIARQNFHKLELLADVRLVHAILQTVDGTGNGHVKKSARRNPLTIAPPPSSGRGHQRIRRS